MSKSVKRLFMLRHGNRGLPVKGDNGDVLYFANKQDAKKHRDTIEGCYVSPGPDHWKYREGGNK